MTRSLESLPLEIIELIFGHLEKPSDLLQCQLTIRKWAPLAKKRLCENVQLHTKTKSMLFIQSIRNSSDNFGHHVKSLSLVGEWTLIDVEDVFDTFTQLCPNVQLFSLNQDDLLFYEWEEIATALSKGKWPLLERIPTSNSLSGIQKYTELALERQSKLQSLILWSPGRENENDFNRLVSNLSSFGNLKKLDIRINQSMEVSSLERVLKNSSDHPRLEHIIFNRPNTTARELQLAGGEDNMAQNPIGNVIYEQQPEMSMIRPYPNVKIFEGARLPFTDSSLNYLMVKFPRLHKLSLTESGILASRRSEVSPHIMSAFLEYISRIRSLDLFFYVKSSLPVVVNSLIQSVFHRDTFPKMTIKYTYSDSTFTNGSYMKVCNRALLYENNVSNRENIFYGDRSDGIEILFPVPLAQNEATGDLPHFELITYCQHELEELHLKHDHGLFLGVGNWQIPTKKLGSSIAGIMELCHSLKILTLDLLDLRDCNSTRYLTNSSVETLNIMSCRMDDNTLPMLSARLASLKKLTFTSWSQGGHVSWRYSPYINMPDTRIDHIFWEDYISLYNIDNYVKVYLKVSSSNGVKFFILDKGELIDSS